MSLDSLNEIIIEAGNCYITVFAAPSMTLGRFGTWNRSVHDLQVHGEIRTHNRFFEGQFFALFADIMLSTYLWKRDTS